ncbi:hypothetical protein AB4274_02350 [Vibrio sp. 10N.261.55.A10]|uniref:hypothetical protein n=1 Tax=Vibrio sp. 10N.261.55.A10 TaxID=3229687 RepID=UPI00354D416F
MGPAYILPVVSPVFFVGLFILGIQSSTKENTRQKNTSGINSAGTKTANSTAATAIATAATLDLLADDDSLYDSSNSFSDQDSPIINPATGLTMMGGIDSAGNPFGTDLTDTLQDSFSSLGSSTSSTGFDDPFSSSSIDFDDSFSSSSIDFDDSFSSTSMDDDFL